MQSPSDWLQLAGQLLREDSLPHSTGLFVPARHAGMSQNIGVDKISAPAKISLIFAEGNAAHLVGSDKPLQTVMAVWRTFFKFEVCQTAITI
jgi:hypothetical protein